MRITSSSKVSTSAAPVYMLNLDQVKPGDILLSRVPGFTNLSGFIRVLSGFKSISGEDVFWDIEDFSHAAIYVSVGMFVEAVGRTGVCRLAISQTAAKDKENIKLLRLGTDVPNAEHIAQRAGQRAQEYVYRDYSLKGLGGIMSKALQDSERNRLFCSQLVACAYEEAGFPLFSDVTPEEVTPGRLSRCKYLKDITKESIIQIYSNDKPEFYLDGPDRSERIHHQEVLKLQQLVHRPKIRKVLKELRIVEPPPTFLRLQEILIKTRDVQLDRAIKKEFDKLCLAKLNEKMWTTVRKGIRANQDEIEKIKTSPEHLNDNDLFLKWRLAENMREQIQEYYDEVKYQINVYKKLRKNTHLMTFHTLYNVYRPSLNMAKEGLRVMSEESQLLSKEVKRRGLA